MSLALTQGIHRVLDLPIWGQGSSKGAETTLQPLVPILGLAHRRHLVSAHIGMHTGMRTAVFYTAPSEVPAVLGGGVHLRQPSWAGPCSELLPAQTLPRQAIRERPGIGDSHPNPGTSKAWHTCSHQQLEWLTWGHCTGVLTCLASPGEGSRAHAHGEGRTGLPVRKPGQPLSGRMSFLTAAFVLLGQFIFHKSQELYGSSKVRKK